MTPHGFRHILATLLYEGNSSIRPKDVQYMLGHKSVNTALEFYTHITKKQKENLSDSLDNLDL
ncbi:tyrosine-type recombinase/integrase [Lactobacillus sp. PV037]|uniref:tyrosine-type recombinase/integrase n=1 Tax=unclassified Lactobacillus TaxID=2620435 RepID=UPI003A102CE5|nr:tyrosine-type recombinase/integrase [Lactobacillus sp. PV012]QNQ84446.1 tyrosine-type recombinase/integrase [Lactobacillus sp. PV037]